MSISSQIGLRKIRGKNVQGKSGNVQSYAVDHFEID